MKVVSSESSNIAWFKLADFVARGEKERALTIHRLLMHSVDERAFAYQLEGDILYAFDDEMALNRYHAAANVYKKDKKYKRAIAVYHHALLKKNDLSIVEELLNLYILLNDEKNLISIFILFTKICLEKKEAKLLADKLASLKEHVSESVHFRLYEIYTSAFISVSSYK
jgi:hypothetical protein